MVSMAMLNNQRVTIVNGDYFMVYKPTNITGGPHPVEISSGFYAPIILQSA